jgi:hypothetical protein
MEKPIGKQVACIVVAFAGSLRIGFGKSEVAYVVGRYWYYTSTRYQVPGTGS